MKNYHCSNDVWKDKMVRHWENLVLMYKKSRESPSFRIGLNILWELLKILLRILITKVLVHILDKT